MLLALLQDDLYMIRPVISILELLIILIYLGHFCGCFFYLMSTPKYHTQREYASNLAYTAVLTDDGYLTTSTPKTFVKGNDRP